MKIVIFGNTMTVTNDDNKKYYKDSTFYYNVAKIIEGKRQTVLKALPGSMVDNERYCVITSDGRIYGEDELTFNTSGVCKLYNNKKDVILYRLV